MQLTLIDAPTKLSACRGAVFRASVQNFRTKRGGFGFTVRLVPMKRLSCPGCEACWWQHDNFLEVGNDWPIENLTSAEDGEFYTIGVCNEGVDRETGAVDSWDLCLENYKEVKIK